MADHEAAVGDRLLAVTAVTDLIGARLWYSVLPEEPPSGTYMPAVVVQQVGGVSEYVFGGKAGKLFSRIQVDSYDEDRPGCAALMAEVQTALEVFHGTLSGVELDVVEMNTIGARWQPAAKLWRGIQEFGLWGTDP